MLCLWQLCTSSIFERFYFVWLSIIIFWWWKLFEWMIFSVKLLLKVYQLFFNTIDTFEVFKKKLKVNVFKVMLDIFELVTFSHAIKFISCASLGANYFQIQKTNNTFTFSHHHNTKHVQFLASIVKSSLHTMSYTHVMHTLHIYILELVVY